MEGFIKHKFNRLMSECLITCAGSLTSFYLDITDLIIFQNKGLREYREFV